MDLSYGEQYAAFRREVREFLRGWPLRGAEAQLEAEEQERRFRQRGIERGYVYRSIPVEYGGSGQLSDPLADAILEEEYAAAGAPGDLRLPGPAMLAPTLIEFGSESQKRRFVPPTLRGELVWCQGYSEPGAGSDLASLQSSARLEGDAWVIRGHKIWTSNAHRADYMFGLFRTEPDAPKHAGISYLLVDMRQPGIEVRPLRQLTGGLDFNEVFLDGAKTPADHVVGGRGRGWQVSRATLVHERNLMGSPGFLRDQFAKLLALARKADRGGRPALEDPGVRRRLAEIEGYVRAAETSNRRLLSASARGRELSVVLPMMMAKLYSTDTLQRIAKAGWDLVGGEGLLAPPGLPGVFAEGHTAPEVCHDFLFSLGLAIAGGASNVQRNIIAERGLGLPRDPRPAR